MSENATAAAAAAPGPEPESNTVKQQPDNVEREVGNILKFLDLADGKEVVNVGLTLTNALSSCEIAAAKTVTNYAPTPGVGIVTKWFPTRGFGFVKSEGSSEDLFAHMTEIEGKFNSLSIGKTVSFTRAYNVKRGKFQATKVSGEGCIKTRPTRSRGICFDFQKGVCTRGAGCRFIHARSGRGRGGYNRRGRGGYNRRGRGRYHENPYAYNYGGNMYGVPYGNGYEMAGYGGFPMMGYGGGMYGGRGGEVYPPFHLGPGAYGGASRNSFGMYGDPNDGEFASSSTMGESSPTDDAGHVTGITHTNSGHVTRITHTNSGHVTRITRTH